MADKPTVSGSGISETATRWPRKTRELHNHFMDSTGWNDFPFRDDDIVVVTYSKSGTTWVQQIVGQLVFQGDENIAIHKISPWLDLRITPSVARDRLEAQSHRRIIKTHLPADALVMSPKAKYVYIGRDGRDVLFSLYNHHVNANQLWYDTFNNPPELVGEPIVRPDPDVRRYFRTWLERDGYPFWSLWENISAWWSVRDLPNVRLLHFEQLKKDLAGTMRGLAEFLEIDTPETSWPTLVEHCTFDYMKANAEHLAPQGGAIFEGGAKTFFHKGVNGRWRDVLSAEENTAYERTALERLGPDCANWLAKGSA
jgi:aryl sulfotransferase